MSHRNVFLALVALSSPACSSIVAHSRRIGPTQPPREFGCDLEMLPSPQARPTVIVAEASCNPGDDADDRLACQDQIRDQLCDLGAEAFSARTEPSGRIVAVGLRNAPPGTAQGPGPGPGWGAPQQQPQPQPTQGQAQWAPQGQQQFQQQPQLVQPPQAQPGQCVPPCPGGTHCSADGRRCEPDAAAPGATTASFTAEEIRDALDRIRRRVLRCRPRGDENDVTVELEVEPAGSVASVRIDGPLANTDAGGCIESAIFRATFPTFEGANRSIRHSFTPNP